jgi:ABC-type sugar transport system ATPase subunit
MSDTQSLGTPVLEVRNLSKHFGAVKAVEGLGLSLYKNEITALVGDNGAGKSTFIKVLSGVHAPTTGEIYINGEAVDITGTQSARKLGIETVYQSQALIDSFDGALNLYLGREKIRDDIWGRLFRFLDYKGMRASTSALVKRLGVNLTATEPVYQLSGGQRRSLEVGRAVHWGGQLIIFDEPTNNLGVEQTNRIMELIRSLRDQFNVSILFVSHDLEYVFRLVDRVVVLRNGQKVADKRVADTNREEIVSYITGAVA